MKALLKSTAAGAALALLATAASAAGTDWPVSGHDAGGQRYSPLTQINKSNVANLQIAWTYHLTPAGYTGRPRLAEAIPIVIGNSMYISSGYGEVIALNATTGAEIWKFKLPDNDTPTARGVAYWTGGKGAPASDRVRQPHGPALFASTPRPASRTTALASTASSISRRRR